MTKSDLLKVKQLHQFLKDNNINLRGNDITLSFDNHKFNGKTRSYSLRLDLGWVKHKDAQVDCNTNSIVKDSWIIDYDGQFLKRL